MPIEVFHVEGPTHFMNAGHDIARVTQEIKVIHEQVAARSGAVVGQYVLNQFMYEGTPHAGRDQLFIVAELPEPEAESPASDEQ